MTNADCRSISVRMAQINLARSITASDEFLQICVKEKIDIACIQEPYNRSGKLYLFDTPPIRVIHCLHRPGITIWAAIVILNPKIDILARTDLMSEHFAVASVNLQGQKPFNLVSGYFQFRVYTGIFVEKMTSISRILENRMLYLVDSNAKHKRWFHPFTTDKGRMVSDFIDTMGLIILNRPGFDYTYIGPRGRSNIDLSLVTGDLASNVVNWSCNNDKSPSDHSVIRFSLLENFKLFDLPIPVRFNDKDINKKIFCKHLSSFYEHQNYDATDDIEVRVCKITTAITLSCEKLLFKKKQKPRPTPPWWNNDVTLARKAVRRARRLRKLSDPSVTREQYNSIRNDYTWKIRSARLANWKKAATSPCSLPKCWNNITRWIKSGTADTRLASTIYKDNESGILTQSLAETAMVLVQNLIPSSVHDESLAETSEHIENSLRSTEPKDVSHITEDYVAFVIGKQSNGSPGIDGITARIIKASWPVIGREFTQILRDCVRTSYFPVTWKVARVNIIIKSRDKDPLRPNSYRPISLLPVFGKILEEIQCAELETSIAGSMSPDLHGFMKGKSTMSAVNELLNWTSSRTEKHVICAFLDISGAFDNVKWSSLIKDMKTVGATLRDLKATINYLSARKAIFNLGSVSYSTILTRGCPQGSKYGPKLWTFIANSILTEIYDENTKVIAYADDFAILTAGNTRKEVIASIEKALELFSEWATGHRLSFSMKKSAVLPLKGGLVPGFTVRFGQHRMTSIKSVKYLGITVQENIIFDEHFENVLDSSCELFSRLRSVVRSKWGVSYEHAVLIYKAIYVPRILYGVSAWLPKTNKSFVKRTDKAQRRALKAITGAYETVSTRALQVIAGVLPMDLLLTYNKEKEDHPNRNQLLDEKIGVWQDRWTNSTKGRWSYRFLPDVKSRMLTPLSLDHYTTQMISGHGDFNGKLNSFKLVDDPACKCGFHSETADYFLFECPRNITERNQLARSIEEDGSTWPIKTEEFVLVRKRWDALRFAYSCLTRKEREKAEIET